MKSRPRIIVFDVNETLLDIAPLGSLFGGWFGECRVMREWFAQLVLYSQTLTLSGRYLDFGEIAAAALGMTARIKGTALPDGAADTLKSAIAALPAHSDVEPALQRMRGAGLSLVTLTNSGAAVQRRQLENAGISHLFDAQFSVETAQAFKPARPPYDGVASALSVRPRDLMLVACHAWDIIGARAAGLETAFIARPGNAQLDLPETQASYTADSLDALAAQLLA